MIQSIIYSITTNKNIRCYGCVDKCEKFQAEKYVSLEDFSQNMQTLKNILNPLELHFSGGEPLLHKELEELCKIANAFFPETQIYIHTNGILMNTLKDKQLLNLTKNYNVNFLFYLYPISNYLKNYQKIIQRFQTLKIDMFWTHEQIYFNNFSINRYGNTCKQTLKDKKQLFIVDNKIYPLCPVLQNIQCKLIEENLNYIEINKLENIQQIIDLFSQVNCQFCCNNSVPLSNLYVNNYAKYEKLIDYVYDLGYYLQYPFFYKNIQDSTSAEEFKMLLTRQFNGQLDIYIPYYKNILTKDEIIELKKFLIGQKDIDKFNLYFVSIDEDKETQQYFFEIFSNNLNTYFLKGKSLYLGEKTFFNNSRNNNHYILDITNLNLLKNDPLFLSNISRRKQK